MHASGMQKNSLILKSGFALRSEFSLNQFEKLPLNGVSPTYRSMALLDDDPFLYASREARKVLWALSNVFAAFK